MKTDRKIAVSFASAHFVSVVLIAGMIASGLESDWPMLWMLLVIVDFPASLLLHLISYIFWLSGIEAGGGDPLRDIPNFWLPLVFFASIGTIWWYFLGLLFSRVFSVTKSKIIDILR